MADGNSPNSEAGASDGLDPRGGVRGGAPDPSAASGIERSDILSAITPLLGPNTRAERLEEISEQRRKISAQKRKLTLAFRNEKRRKARLVAKSSRLSDLELLDVLRDRQAKKAKRDAAH